MWTILSRYLPCTGDAILDNDGFSIDYILGSFIKTDMLIHFNLQLIGYNHKLNKGPEGRENVI